MNRIKKMLSVSLLSLLWLKATAQLSIPKIIAHNMVLQRHQPIPVWGMAKAGDAVTVTFNQQEKKTVADKTGNWKIMLDAMEASATPQQLIIKGSKKTIVLENILVGEVWLCSGQSNMEYTMRKNSKVTMTDSSNNWPVNELQTAHNKNIRIFLVDRKKMKPDPYHSGWDIAADSALRSFSAAGYFFAKKLFEELQVPVGVIASSVPGSRIEPWMPEEAFTALPFFSNQTDSSHQINGEPGKFYQTMIAPLAPFAMKGFLWYQGESNCFLGERLQYTYKMKALINQWRKLWNNDSMPFYYVQIAPFAYSKQKGLVNYTEESLPEFWEAQALALKIPHTAMVGTTDLNFKLDDLHPHYKWEIGKRLALCALANVYDKKNIVFSGPQYQSMTIKGNKIILDFKYTGSGLISKDGKPLKDFTIAIADGRFFPAIATIKNNHIELSAPDISHPVAARFNWNEAGQPNLFNKEGLPALPFRTDNPLNKKFED
jgi:sialate O-acetylesterase